MSNVSVLKETLLPNTGDRSPSLHQESSVAQLRQRRFQVVGGGWPAARPFGWFARGQRGHGMKELLALPCAIRQGEQDARRRRLQVKSLVKGIDHPLPGAGLDARRWEGQRPRPGDLDRARAKTEGNGVTH